MERRITQLEIEKQALLKEKDDGSKARLGKLEEELAQLKEENAGLQAQWQKEVEQLSYQEANTALELTLAKLQSSELEVEGQFSSRQSFDEAFQRHRPSFEPFY